MPATPVMQRLRNETKSAHQQLEKLTLPYIKAAKNMAAYARLLQLFYGFFRPMETEINSVLGNTGIIRDLHERRQTSALQQDLQHIGEPADDLAVMTDLPQIETIAQALGALYVLEGSTLGGQIITGILAKQMQRSPEDGLSFFNSYGAQTAEKWTAFTTAVNEYSSEHPGQANAIVASAENTFNAFADWVKVQEQVAA